tara:strand:- start:6151 stop:7059 length:909 start_codon:yes stop_codon:yes gene_type:complete
MNKIKNGYTYVLKSIKKDMDLKPVISNLKNKTFIVSGGTRGIGFNIAKKLALIGANVTIIGKTQQKHEKLESTIYSSADEINELIKRPGCMGIPCDVRVPKQIEFAINETIDIYGGIDGVVLNASALCLNNTLQQTEKEVDLMTAVNIKGTYLFGQKCLQYMSDHNRKGHMLIIAPPVEMLYNDEWWTNHLFYSMSKFNMSLMSKYWNKEFPNVGINTLWPRTTIDTAPVRNLLGGKAMVDISRTADIMGDAAEHVMLTDPEVCNGKHLIDDEVLASLNIDVEQYRVNKNKTEKELMPDFFC